MYSFGEVPVIIEDINNDGLSDILISAYESSQGWSTYLLLKDNSTTLSYDERKLNSTSGLMFVEDIDRNGFKDILYSSMISRFGGNLQYLQTSGNVFTESDLLPIISDKNVAYGDFEAIWYS